LHSSWSEEKEDKGDWSVITVPNVCNTNMFLPIGLSAFIVRARTNPYNGLFCSAFDNSFTYSVLYWRSFNAWPFVLVFAVIVAFLTCMAVVSF